MQKSILIVGRVALVLVFLVMLAGSVVRMTGSGMGCPDWPKCFGYFIPPTDEVQLTWKPDQKYFKGQMIIFEESLLVSQDEFISGATLEPDNWKHYDKHDYAIFNASHTWTEYINRLLGALSGIPVLLLFVLSLWNVRRDFITFLLSTMSLTVLGFVAWLGKLVVDGNLIPNSITIHMFSALALLFLIVAIIFRQRRQREWLVNLSGKMQWLAIGVFALSLVQIFMGTKVREQVDAVGHSVSRGEWIDQLGNLFLVHRSFSILVVLLNVWLVFLLIRAGFPEKWPRILLGLIGVEIFAGVLLNYFGFPAWAQPVHLLTATFIVAIQLYLCLRLWFGVRALQSDSITT